MKRAAAERQLLLKRRVAQAQADPRGLGEAATFYAALIEVLIAESPTIELPALDDHAIEAKWASGQPLLANEALGIDLDAVQKTFMTLCTVAERHGVSAAAQIRAALNSGSFDMDNLLVLLLSGDERGLAALAAGAQVEPPLFGVIAHFALRPTLFAFAEAYTDRVTNFGRGWQRTFCPICGGPPLLSEYRDIDQSRHLRCAHCATTWLYPRMQCAWCGSDDFRRLPQLTLEDDARYRVDLCAVCGRYLKGMLAEEPLPSDLLPLEDLLSLPLDAMARQAGYRQAEASAGTPPSM